MKTLDHLYTLMQRTAVPRRKIVNGLLSSRPQPRDLERLRDVRRQLLSWPQHEGKFIFGTRTSGEIAIKLDYELNELEKDIVFLQDGPGALFELMSRAIPDFEAEVRRLTGQLGSFIGQSPASTFITDRDGTVNNYCGRYRSSIQSAYNAFFLTRFARGRTRRSVVLSSAPLENGGLIDVSVNPAGVFVYAGSKGREYRDEHGNRGHYPIAPAHQATLDRFNACLEALLEHEENRIFTLVGSSLQFKFGQTTVARQDVDTSVPQRRSDEFLQAVTALVHEVDPQGRFLRIEDTGKDIEVLLTVEGGADKGSGTNKDFDKGNGIDFLDRELSLGLEQGDAIVCGDTASDVSMVEAVARRAPRTLAVFVGADAQLAEAVRAGNRSACFVSSPDVLVSALYRYATAAGGT